MKLRVVIAEDEPLGRERLRELLQAEPLVEVVAECENGAEAVRAIRACRPHVVFLDVRMPELDGFGVIETLGVEEPPAFVIVTAHEQFALAAFDVEAADYLLKPFDRERLRTSLRRVRNRLRSVQRPTAEGAAALATQTLMVKSQGKIILLRTSEIDWIGASDNYLELHAGKATHLIRGTMTGLLNQLQGGPFTRVSRSAAVNVGQIKEIHSRTHGDYLVILRDGTRIEGSRKFRDALRQIQRGG